MQALSRALPWAGLLLASCSGASVPGRGVDGGSPRCQGLQEEAQRLVAAAPCSADWECQRYLPHFLGCGSFAPASFGLGASIGPLEDACAAASLAPTCPAEVGTCQAGRCGSRPQGRPQACLAARQALAQALVPEAACTADRDCEVALEARPPLAAPRGYRLLLSRELHAIADSCAADEEKEVELQGQFRISSCVEGRCSMLLGSSAEYQASWKRTAPRASEDRCVINRVLVPPGHISGTLTVVASFTVSERGVPQGFRFLEAAKDGRATGVPLPVQWALMRAISECRWVPGTDEEGRPATMGVVMPFRFSRG